jgi:hypothetical protein
MTIQSLVPMQNPFSTITSRHHSALIATSASRRMDDADPTFHGKGRLFLLRLVVGPT